MPRHEVGVDQELCNQKSATVPHAVEVKLGLGDPPCPFRGLGVRVTAGDPVRQRLDLRREQRVGENWNVQAMSKCVLRRASLSRRSLGPCSISRWRDWRAVGGRWSRRRCSADFSSVDVTEFRVLNFIDRLSHRGAKSCAVTLDLPQSVVAGGFRSFASSGSKRFERQSI